MSFQYLRCRPLDQVYTMRLHGNVRTTVKVQLSGTQEQTSLWFFGSQEAHWWEAGGLGGASLTDGASVENCRPRLLTCSGKRAKWAGAQPGGRNAHAVLKEKRPAGRPAWLRRGARSSFPSFFWQHLWRNIAFSFEHFEQKKIERDPEDEKRRHPLKFKTLSGLNMSIIFFQIRFHWTELLSSLPTKIYFSHGSTFFFSCICPLGLCISNMLQKILIFLWIHVKNLLYFSFGCGVSYLCFICLFVIYIYIWR